VRDGSLCRSGSGDLRADGKHSDYPEVLAARSRASRTTRDHLTALHLTEGRLTDA
jgi:hypothetical protein